MASLEVLEEEVVGVRLGAEGVDPLGEREAQEEEVEGAAVAGAQLVDINIEDGSSPHPLWIFSFFLSVCPSRKRKSAETLEKTGKLEKKP